MSIAAPLMAMPKVLLSTSAFCAIIVSASVDIIGFMTVVMMEPMKRMEPTSGGEMTVVRNLPRAAESAKPEHTEWGAARVER